MISVDGLAVEFGGTTLFSDISFVINEKDRIALMGKNGAGKSTLLKILAGVRQPTRGKVSAPKDCVVAYLPQHLMTEDGRTVFDETVQAFAHLHEMEAQIDRLNKELETRTDYESDSYMALIEEVSALSEKFYSIDATNYEEDVEKSLLGLGLTVVCIFSILIPLLLGGWPTLPTILGMCAYVTVVEFVILGGVNRKTLCAILGTISGVAFAALFGELACALLRVNGYKMYSAEPTIEALLQIKQGQDPMHSLQLGDLLVGGIVIAALGAVNDVAMSISSAMNELVAVNPALTRRQLLRSGMNIGRDMVGTMTNTLILALVGSSLVLMIYLSSLEPSFSQLMSGTFFSVEMVQAIASSVGVILAVPLSALIGAFLFAKHKK